MISVTGKVASIALSGVLDPNALELGSNHVKAECDLIPGPNRPLCIGRDDELIQQFAQTNLFHLGEEQHKCDRFYVASVEIDFLPLSLDGVRAKPQSGFRPLALIHANCMKEAIRKFEEEHGRRLWVPLNGEKDRFNYQLGIARGDKSVKKVMIHCFRKDCIL